jgi:hypothetical protein
MNVAASLLVIAALFFYLLPSMIAAIRKVEHDGAIIAINVLFGWTVRGWNAMLIWAVVLALSLIISACTIPVFQKEEMRSRNVADFTRSGSYIELVKYWDEHAEKAMIDFHSATFLTLWDADKKAEITVGTGPYYGMIELTQESDNCVRIRAYAWGTGLSGGPRANIEEWLNLLRAAPD